MVVPGNGIVKEENALEVGHCEELGIPIMEAGLHNSTAVQQRNKPTRDTLSPQACRALNGIGQRKYESPILKSAAQEQEASCYQSARQMQLYANRQEVSASSQKISSSPGEFNFLEEEKRKEKGFSRVGQLEIGGKQISLGRPHLAASGRHVLGQVVLVVGVISVVYVPLLLNVLPAGRVVVFGSK